jgi:multiple sugar transport system permease protein/putative aldouronate transport system permease protein
MEKMVNISPDRSCKAPSDRGDLFFHLGANTLLALAMVLVIYPLVYIVSASFSSSSAVVSGRVWLLPVDFSLSGYRAVFDHAHIVTGYMNSLLYTVLGTLFNLFLTVAAAYPLSRTDFRARNMYMLVFMVTMFFSGGLIPTYILISRLGLINTRLVMMVYAGLSFYNVVIMRTYFQANISRELLEAAQVDGLSDAGILVWIILPLSKAILAVIGLFYAVGHWNAFFNAFLFLSDRKLFPLQLILREILIQNSVNFEMMQNIPLEELEAKENLAELLKYSLIVVSSVPLLCAYPFIQKHFVKGVMIGAIKG